MNNLVIPKDSLKCSVKAYYIKLLPIAKKLTYDLKFFGDYEFNYVLFFNNIYEFAIKTSNEFDYILDENLLKATLLTNLEQNSLKPATPFDKAIINEVTILHRLLSLGNSEQIVNVNLNKYKNLVSILSKKIGFESLNEVVDQVNSEVKNAFITLNQADIGLPICDPKTIEDECKGYEEIIRDCIAVQEIAPEERIANEKELCYFNALIKEYNIVDGTFKDIEAFNDCFYKYPNIECSGSNTDCTA